MKELLSTEKIKEICSLGEDSFYQFKKDITNAESLAEEMVAFSNASGGYILIGIDDKTNTVTGLTAQDIHRINNLIGNASSENCVPKIHPLTENKVIDGNNMVIVQIEEGSGKPYQTKSGKYLTKSGSDKRILSAEELARLFQVGGHYHIEETAIPQTSIEADLDKGLFYQYFESIEKISTLDFLQKNKMTLTQLLQNKNLAVNDQLSLLGLLFFSRNPQQYKPLYGIDVVHFYGTTVSDNDFISKEFIGGTVDIQFKRANTFLKNQLSKVSSRDGFNNNGQLEIAEEALEEAIINAIIHRNYSINATIKIFVFKDRVEIISPGRLPNSLDEDKIKYNNSIPRNPLISNYGREILPFSGLGTGIPRIVRHQPDTVFINDKESEKFTVVFPRKIVS